MCTRACYKTLLLAITSFFRCCWSHCQFVCGRLCIDFSGSTSLVLYNKAQTVSLIAVYKTICIILSTSESQILSIKNYMKFLTSAKLTTLKFKFYLIATVSVTVNGVWAQLQLTFSNSRNKKGDLNESCVHNMELYLHSVYIFILCLYLKSVKFNFQYHAKPDQGVCIQVNVITRFK